MTGSVVNKWTLALLVLLNSQFLAADSQQHDAIRATAETFARQELDDSGLFNIRVEAAELDARLKLAPCAQPLEAFATGTSRQVSRATVGVRCNGEKPWTLYVPVRIMAEAKSVFTTRPLLRGEALTRDAIELRQVPVDELPLNYIGDTTQLAGMETGRPLKAGVALTLNALKPRQFVKQGQEVQILAVSGGIQVRMSGKALRGGSKGDFIPVRNASSGRTVEAQILDLGTVKVNF